MTATAEPVINWVRCLRTNFWMRYSGAGRAGEDRLVAQVPLDVLGQAVGRLVAARPVLLQGLHHDPVEVALDQLAEEFRAGVTALGDVAGRLAERADLRRGLERVGLADDPLHLVVARRCEASRRRTACCPSAARRAARPASRCRCGCRCPGRSFPPARGSCTPACRPSGRSWVNSVCSVSRWFGRLGDAEVDDLGHRLAVVQRDQDVGRLDVAVDDAFLVGVLHRLADRDEQLQPLARRQLVRRRSTR